LLVAFGLACQLAQAGDRKPDARRIRESREEIAVAHKMLTTTALYERISLSTVTPSEAKYSVSAERPLIEARERESLVAPAKSDHKSLTLFHLNSRVGDIVIQPVFGHVKGAQFSIGF
jgi:hypothetical protein